MAIVAASVIGRAHRRQGRGGQDAWAASRCGGVVAVADGCSAGRGSEIGAGVGVRAAVSSALRHRASGVALVDLPARVIADVLAVVRDLARAMAVDADDAARVIEASMLFTLHVAVTGADGAVARADTREDAAGTCVVFGIGDGVIAIDGLAHVIEQGDAPDYLAYALFPHLTMPRLLVHHVGRFTSIAVCTDGARELLARADDTLADGSALGGLACFERDARFVRNPSLAQKRLLSWCDATGGPVDDCTLVVLRDAAFEGAGAPTARAIGGAS